MIRSHNVRLGIVVGSILAVAGCGSDADSTPEPTNETGSDTSSSDSPIDTIGIDTIGIDTSVSDTGGDTAPSAVPTIGGCPIFTTSDAWNRNVASDPVDASWTGLLYTNALLKNLHPDFGPGGGIPFNVVPATQPKLTIGFDYPDESDPGPYPFPGGTAKIEGGSPTACSGDCHVLTILQGSCLLYEAWDCHFNATATSWQCGSGAKFDLTKDSYGQRPMGWTSADAAGLAILPGLVKYSEVAAGVVKHAIRFTMHCTQDGYVKPASHKAVPRGPKNCPTTMTTTDLRAGYPPMGLRIRLKESYAIASLPAQAKVIAQAMKTYGMILADNGSDYFFQGDDDPGWDNDQLNALKAIPGDAFEVLTPGTISR